MELSAKILSDIVIHMKYARYREDLGRRETWEEITIRNKNMHIKKYPWLSNEIEEAYKLVRERKVLPSMRALEDSTPILTKEGWKTAGAIQKGDVLYDSSGNETSVIDTVSFKEKKLYRIVFSDHSEIVACGEHLWNIYTNDDFKYKKEARTVDTLFLKEHLKQGDRNNIHIKNPEPIKKPNKLLELDPYILGHWLGDGYSSGYQYSADLNDGIFIKEQYEKGGFVVKQSTSSNVWTYTANGLGTKLGKYNLINNKHIPSDYLDASIEQRLCLLQGLMDSDGTISSEGRCSFSNTSDNIIYGIKFILSSLGIKYTTSIGKRADKKHKEITRISFFTTLPVFRLPRKAEKIRKEHANNRTQFRTVLSVEEVERGNATCFHVDSPDHTFLAGRNLIVTHNSAQFAGKPIEINPSRIYNCSFCPVDHWKVFSEIMFLLLGGTGCGYSVQRHHVDKLPEIKARLGRNRRYLVGDSIEGWADAVKMLASSYFHGTSKIVFDFSDIRPKGERLVTSGGKAPGPQPLKDCIHNLDKILSHKEPGDKLTPLECHDMICYIADAVLAGGIRRAALISLFSLDDDDMIACKYGNWWESNPQRGRANNSAVILRHKIDKNTFMSFWEKIKASRTGEPGIFLTFDKEVGTNPCAEISLKPNSFCNLTTINVSDVEDQAELNRRVRAAALIGTLQATYTDFHYLRDCWRRATEKDSLLGVSMTGIASNKVFDCDLKEAAQIVLEENEQLSKMLGINKAARATCVKPEGSSSLVVGTSSGIHAWYAPYYIRRIRVGKNEAIYQYLKKKMPSLVEDDFFKKQDAVISIPVKSPEGAIYSSEKALNILERVKRVSMDWVHPGHRKGDNKHNVSATIATGDDEWDEVGKWMWENRKYYAGLTVLPRDGGTYKQMPFEEISKEEYDRLFKELAQIDLSEVGELEDNTDLQGEIACGGGSCEIK